MAGRDIACANRVIFFFQAEDGIRGAQESRGLGDVYKRQVYDYAKKVNSGEIIDASFLPIIFEPDAELLASQDLSLIHI